MVEAKKILENQIILSTERLKIHHYPKELEPFVQKKIQSCKEAIALIDSQIHQPKYKHEKTGGIYTFVSNGLVQIDGTWLDSVNYKDDKGNPFTRTFTDFHSKFTIIP